MLSAVGLGQALLGLGDQKEGLMAAKRIFNSIEDGINSSIDGLSQTGLKPPHRATGTSSVISWNDIFIHIHIHTHYKSSPWVSNIITNAVPSPTHFYSHKQSCTPILINIGRIELKNVTFRYPTRPEMEVCKDYSLVIEPGKACFSLPHPYSYVLILH